MAKKQSLPSIKREYKPDREGCIRALQIVLSLEKESSNVEADEGCSPSTNTSPARTTPDNSLTPGLIRLSDELISGDDTQIEVDLSGFDLKKPA